MSTLASTETLGRFHILKPTQLVGPGKCAVCGKFSGDHFIDFGLELDFYGVVYICVSDCFREMANLQEYFSPNQHKMALAELADKRDELNTALDKIEVLENVIYGLRSLGDSSASSSSDVVVVEQPVEIQGPDNTKPAKSAKRSDESVDERGSTDLLNDDSLAEFLGADIDL